MDEESRESIPVEDSADDTVRASRQRKTAEVKLPSGLVLEMAQLRFAEESLMAKARNASKTQMEKVLQQVMGRCTVAVVDPGPYSDFKEGDKPDWNKMLQGDYIDAMLQLRKISYKEGASILIPSIKCPSCREMFSWEINSDEDLRRQSLPAESAERFKTGKPFSFEVDGCRVEFRLSTGETMKLYTRGAKQFRGREAACAIRSQITDVYDQSGKKIERREIMDWIDGDDGHSKKFPGLMSDDAEVIRDQFDRVDTGVDLEIEATCPQFECGATVWVDLPFDTIFLPGKGIQKRKMERRRGISRSES